MLLPCKLYNYDQDRWAYVDTIRSCHQHDQCNCSMQYVHLFAPNDDTVIPPGLIKPLHNIPSFIVISLNIARSAMHMGMHVSGGLRMEAYKDVDSCLAGCTGNCRAVDYDSGENSCWFHYDFSVCNQLLRKLTCTHWKAVTCGKPEQGC